MTVSGTQSLEKAFVTGGGISVKEIEPKTMALRKRMVYSSAVKSLIFMAIQEAIILHLHLLPDVLLE